MTDNLQIQKHLDRIENKLDKKYGNDWLSTREASRYSGCHPKTLHRAVRRGDLRVSQKLGKNLFKREWLDRWLKGR